ncbi:MAG: hypothetical protein RIR51_325 [Bacteroidota bacterium]|jgi:predicted NBD/HSP70 family sugar kinase
MMTIEGKNQILWGIDLGGTKIECAVIEWDGENLVILARERINTEREKGYEHILSQIQKLVRSISKKLNLKPKSLGIATPGVLVPDTQLMKNSNTLCLNDQPLKRDLENLLDIKIRMANDANCFALAETILGAGKLIKPELCFGVIMGTGVGGGLVVNGKIINGLHGIGGEWGHNILEEEGYDCYCGKSGCVEQVLSGTALEQYYHEISGENKSMKEIVKDYRVGGNEMANQTMERLFEYFGRAISTIINVMDPQLIVLGGGVGNIDEIYEIGYERIRKYIFNSGIVHTPIVKPLLGDSAGVFGAALLVGEL